MNSALNPDLNTDPPPPPIPRDVVAVVGMDAIDEERPQDEFPETEDYEANEAIVAVQSCGVTAAWEAVDIARRNGWKDQQIIDTVEFFLSMRPAWDCGALVNRLKRPGSQHQPIDKGWPTPATQSGTTKSQTTAECIPYLTPDERAVQATNLESLHGKSLDDLPPEQFKELVNSSSRFNGPRERRDAMAMGRTNRELRAKLLRAIDDRAMRHFIPPATPPPE